MKIPRWLLALDEKKPYIELRDDTRFSRDSEEVIKGRLVVRIGAQLEAWASDRGFVGTAIRCCSFRCDGGKWSSLFSDVEFTSFARAQMWADGAVQPECIMPELVVYLLFGADRPRRTQRKVDIALRFGAIAVLVLKPLVRCVRIYYDDGSAEERDARGTWPLEAFDDLVLDWDAIYRGIDVDG